MPLRPRFYEVTPLYAAFKIFGIVVGIILVILGLLYVIYAATRRPRRVSKPTTPDLEAGIHRRANSVNPHTHSGSSGTRDLEPATGTTNRNSCSAHSVDTLPRYEANNNGEGEGEGPSSERVLGGGEREGEGEGEGGRPPPPYTFDAGGPVVVVVVAEEGDSSRDGEQTPALAPVYSQAS